ncbi:spore germination lipoprotein GerD [Paenibacillus agricola]|uniref:Spore gernimation protein n=1 Tax=Paenibacillus agricola TaxID=2716264 RepID=A0ABX0JIM7_9BACL|nr:spore germination lipoprotein GerD [Paenibacillus agricola]NHN35176.1 spore gernimation protein [Paenibacillus agricola]
MKLQWLSKVLSLFLIGLLLSSCGSDTSSSQSQNGGYKDTKTMVMDILKTEDGQQAILAASLKAAAKDEGQLKLLSVGDTQQMQMAVKDVLTDTSNNKFLQTVITDPKFAGEFAKAIQKEMKQLQKDLMKDPEYQQALIGTMNNPDFEKMLLDTMKSTAYRQQTKTVIQESMQSPLFRLELMNVMKKVLEEESQPKQQASSGGDSGSGGSGSGSSGGNGGEKKKSEESQSEEKNKNQ